MKYLISSILVFAFICDLRAETPCELASPLMSGNVATCDGILMPKPWVEDCAVVKEVTLPKSLVDAVRNTEGLDQTQRYNLCWGARYHSRATMTRQGFKF